MIREKNKEHEWGKGESEAEVLDAKKNAHITHKYTVWSTVQKNSVFLK